jgi:hypothetical protein
VTIHGHPLGGATHTSLKAPLAPGACSKTSLFLKLLETDPRDRLYWHLIVGRSKTPNIFQN